MSFSVFKKIFFVDICLECSVERTEISFVRRFWKACLQGSYKLGIARRNSVVWRRLELEGIWWHVWSSPMLHKEDWALEKGDEKEGGLIYWITSMFQALSQWTFNWDAQSGTWESFPTLFPPQTCRRCSHVPPYAHLLILHQCGLPLL